MSPVRERKTPKVKLSRSSQEQTESDGTSGKKVRASPLKLLCLLASVICAVSIYLWTNVEGDGNMVSFATAKQLTNQLVYTVPCSNDYKKEPFHKCVPKKCARVVMDNLVSEEEASSLLRLAKQGLAFGGSSGGASILDLHSGALSKGDKFINIYSILSGDDQFTKKDFQLYRSVKDKIKGAIASYFDVPESQLYLTKPTFFSRMNTTEAKTVHDEYWHPHVDKLTYGSFHYTSLLYLTTYGQDFTGGRFIFIDKDANRTVEPRLGRVSFFTSGSENVHFVEKLESGTRFAITISFTCDPAMAITDPHAR